MRSLLWLISFCHAVLGHPRLANRDQNPVIDLHYARYQGNRLAAGVDEFLGMRYASPPVGDLRFRAPQDPPTNNTLQSATEVIPSLPTFINLFYLASLTVWPVRANLYWCG